MTILHVTTNAYWASQQSDQFIAPTFEQEGFIHCCLQDQLTGVLERYFVGQKDLIVLEIDADKLASPLVFEATVGVEAFPHVYGPINKEAILQIVRL